MSVLVLAGDRDPSVDAVIDLLTGKGVPVFRCDTAWFPTRLSLSAHLDGSRWSGRLRTAHRHIELGDINAVWYRAPTAFALPTGLSAAERRHAGWEAKFGLGGVLADIDALWLNHPHREADLAWKPRQLSRAAACGLAVPPTLITNQADAVREFARTHGEVIIKPLAFNSTTEGGVTSAIYTHALTNAELADLSGIELTAHMVQRRIAKDHETRLTMVGRRPFAAAIHTSSDAAGVDWRTDLASVRLEPTQVPVDVLAGVCRFMDSYHVAFGAFDFAVTPDRRWVMFECNGAAGQWGFVEHATGLPITAAIATALSAAQPHSAAGSAGTREEARL